MSDKDKFVNVADLKRKLSYWGKSRGASKQSIESLMETIGRIPYSVKAELETTLEAEPVKRGQWIHHAGMNSKCSCCGRYFPVAEFEQRPFDVNFCIHCGARMRGDEK